MQFPLAFSDILHVILRLVAYYFALIRTVCIQLGHAIEVNPIW